MRDGEMENIDPSLPMWAQIAATLLTPLAAAILAFKGYGKGTVNPSAPTAPSTTSAVLLGIGGALADKHSAQAMIEALDRIVDELQQSRKEFRRFREAYETSTEETVAEHARLREEAAEIRRRLVDQHNKER